MRTRSRTLLLATAAVLGCTSPPDEGERPRPVIPHLAFSELDANGDDAIDDAEFARIADALFARLDADRNGRLDEAEYARLLERPRARRGSHRRGGSWPEGGGGFPGGGGGPY